jgi:hypothetical protein
MAEPVPTARKSDPAELGLFLGSAPLILLPRCSLPARSGLLLFIVILLSSLCLVVTAPGRVTTAAVAEFALLSPLPSTNLNDAYTEVRPATPRDVREHRSSDNMAAVQPAHGSSPAREQLTEIADSEAATPVERTTATPVLLVPERLPIPIAEAPSPPAELSHRQADGQYAPLIPASALESLLEDCYSICDQHQGDTPMMRTWKMLGLKAILAALFAAAPGLASNTSGPPSEAEKLDAIQKQLNELKTALANLDEKLKDMRTDSNLGTQKFQNQIKDLNDMIGALRQEFATLPGRLPGSTRTAFAPSDTGPGTGTARVEMVNTYSQPVSIVINNRRSYTLQPGERRLSDPIPAGSFTYEVLGVTPVVTRTVAADKSFTLWVHLQP